MAVNKKDARVFRVQQQQQEPVLALLEAQGYAFIPEAMPGNCTHIFRLTQEPKPLGTSLAAFFGLLYIQDKSSMLPPLALMPHNGTTVLDMAASPGSKTSQLAAMAGTKGLVIANEPNPSRLTTLRRNMQVMGLGQVITTCYPAENLPLTTQSLPFILLDPPCSGWGTVEKNPKVLEMWQGEKTLPLVRLQAQLLDKAQEILAPEGHMVYSTCTTNTEENEKQVERFLARHPSMELIHLPPLEGFAASTDQTPSFWRIDTAEGANQGFFVAKFRKKPASAPVYRDNAHSAPQQAQATQQGMAFSVLAQKIIQNEGLDFSPYTGAHVGLFNGNMHLVPQQAQYLPPALRWQGLHVGKVSQNHEPQFSPRVRAFLEPRTLPTLVLEDKEGIQLVEKLLQGQSLPFHNPQNARYALLYWQNMPLGRLRLKQNRAFWSER